MRSFISLELPEDVKNEIEKIQNKIKEAEVVKGKFVEKKNLHLTLKFLGEIDETKLRIVKEKLEKLDFLRFRVCLGNLGVFSKYAIRIIWVGLGGRGLWELQRKVDDVLEEYFEKEKRFMAHITIARPKFVQDREKLVEFLKEIDFEKVGWEVKRFYLRKSKLSEQGANYETLKVFNL